jgi:FixJ family two-component response regulator
MGGFELQEVLRIDNPALPILFLTGHGSIPMSVRAMRSGAFDFIEKPFPIKPFDRVQDAVNRAAELHRQQRHNRSIDQLLALLSPRERKCSTC